MYYTATLTLSSSLRNGNSASSSTDFGMTQPATGPCCVLALGYIFCKEQQRLRNGISSKRLRMDFVDIAAQLSPGVDRTLRYDRISCSLAMTATTNASSPWRSFLLASMMNPGVDYRNQLNVLTFAVSALSVILDTIAIGQFFARRAASASRWPGLHRIAHAAAGRAAGDRRTVPSDGDERA